MNTINSNKKKLSPEQRETLLRTIIKNVLARLFIVTNNIRFTASSFHFIE